MMNILIVDDDIITVEVIVNKINWLELGIDKVYTAYNTMNAKKIILEKHVDIIVSDIEMPQESGLELLGWVRKNMKDCGFLLLTCHENFNYAADAIKYGIDAYLTKPFEAQIMEITLKKVISNLIEKRTLIRFSKYGGWVEKNLSYIKLNFLKALLSGEYGSEEKIIEEIQSSHLDIETDKQYCIIVTKISDAESDVKKYGKNVFEFTLEKLHSEIFSENVINESVVKFSTSDSLSFVTLYNSGNQKELLNKYEELKDLCNKYFKIVITCCISNDYSIFQLSSHKNNIEKLLQYNMNFYGQAFLESEAQIEDKGEEQIIDLEKLKSMIVNKEINSILMYLKEIFNELTIYKKLNSHSLFIIKHEIIQVLYSELMTRGIQATKLFYDSVSIKMENKACESTIDMVKWVKYMLEKTYDYEREITKSSSIVIKINEFIHENYMNHIGRNEIASKFYLTPEYVAKLYKRKTGINLKDYINKYRIDMAKTLLEDKENSITDVSEMVGFENISYFSTIFKKISGISPKEYRSKL